MKRQQINPAWLRKQGIEALCQSLGPLGMARFLLQYETGTGDYTRERDLWLKNIDAETIETELHAGKKKV